MIRIVRTRTLQTLRQGTALAAVLAADLDTAESAVERLTGELAAVRSQRDTAIEDTGTAAAALTAEGLARVLYRAEIAEITSSIAAALSAADTAASVREVSGLLLKHAEVLGIDPHGSGDGAARDDDEKGTPA